MGIGISAISESPLIGYGSWGEGTGEFADKLYKELASEMYDLGLSNWRRSDIFTPHSQLLQSWMEGGLLAAAFFIFLGYQLYLGLKYVFFNKNLDHFVPLYSYFLVLDAWHLIMSPYSGSHRIFIALAIAILCSLRLEKQATEHIDQVAASDIQR